MAVSFEGYERRIDKINKVLAENGISSLEDVQALAGMVSSGVEGAIMGKALYAGKFTLPEALKAAAQSA